MAYRNTKAALRSVSALAATQGGYFTAKQAEEAGYRAPHLVYHVKAGNFERAGHGLYRLPTIPPSDHDDLIRITLWSRGHDDQPAAVVSHQTALGLHELSDLIPTTIHITVPPTFRKRPPKGCIVHKTNLKPTESQDMTGFRVTTPLRTLTDLAHNPSISTEQFDRAVQDALDRGLIRRSQSAPLLSQRHPRTRARTQKARR